MRAKYYFPVHARTRKPMLGQFSTNTGEKYDVRFGALPEEFHGKDGIRIHHCSSPTELLSYFHAHYPADNSGINIYDTLFGKLYRLMPNGLALNLNHDTVKTAAITADTIEIDMLPIAKKWLRDQLNQHQDLPIIILLPNYVEQFFAKLERSDNLSPYLIKSNGQWQFEITTQEDLALFQSFAEVSDGTNITIPKLKFDESSDYVNIMHLVNNSLFSPPRHQKSNYGIVQQTAAGGKMGDTERGTRVLNKDDQQRRSSFGSAAAGS